MSKIVIFSKSIRTIEITDPITTIGRDVDNNIMIHDNMLSRKHCLIEKDRNQLKVIDLKSANGTYVNGVKIKSRTLENEDRIKIGNSILYLTKTKF